VRLSLKQPKGTGHRGVHLEPQVLREVEIGRSAPGKKVTKTPSQPTGQAWWFTSEVPAIQEA
jgi:hypothetical protein